MIFVFVVDLVCFFFEDFGVFVLVLGVGKWLDIFMDMFGLVRRFLEFF